MHMCVITLSANIFLNKGQKFLHFFYKQIIRLCIEKYISYLLIFFHVNYNIHKWRVKAFFFFFENIKDFKLNYYVQHRNSKITKYMVNLVGVFCGADDQKCFLRVLLGFVDWGSEELFLGVFTKNKIFTLLSFLEFYADSEFKIKFLRICLFDGAC